MRRRKRKSAAARTAVCAALLALAFAAVRADPARAGETLAQLLLLSPEMPETAAESAAILPGRPEPDTAAESPPPHEPEEEEIEPAAPPAAQADGEDAPLPEAYVPELTNHTQYKAWITEPDLTDVPALRMDGTAEVLIVHTHSSEAFTADGEDPYLPSDGMRTLDTKYNVVRLGDELAERLTQAGIGVAHDREINDYPSYSGSYSQMRKRIEGYLEKYPSIRIVLDIHRDAILDAKGENLALRARIGGEDTARLMFVVGTDEGGLQHPDWRKNLGFAAALQARGDALYPGLMRPIDLRRERFNQHATAGSLIVEIGSAGNTLAEARRGAACFAEILLRTLGAEKTG